MRALAHTLGNLRQSNCFEFSAHSLTDINREKNNLELIMLIKNQEQQLQFIKCYKPSTVLSTIITNKEQALYDIKI